MTNETDETKKAGGALAVQPQYELQSASPMFDSKRFDHMQRAAKALMNSSMLPDTVRGTNANQCFSNLMLVFGKAEQWGVEALDLVQCVSIVHGRMVYEGKLLQAILQARLGIRLKFDYHGNPEDGDSFGVTVSGVPHGEDVAEEVSGSVGQWKTKERNGDTKFNWRPENARAQLRYRGTREWVRLFEPMLLLGVYTDDEMDAVDGSRAKPIPRPTGEASAGFSEAVEADDVQDGEVIEPAPGSPENPIEDPGEDPQATGSATDETLPDDSEAEALNQRAELAERIRVEYPPLESFLKAAYEDAETWIDLKARFKQMGRTKAWAEANKFMDLEAVQYVWEAVYEMSSNFEDRPKPFEDFTLFRAWIWTLKTPRLVNDAFAELKATDAWSGLNKDNKAAMDDHVRAVLQHLEGQN